MERLKAQGVAHYKLGAFEAALTSFTSALEHVERGAPLSQHLALESNCSMVELKLDRPLRCLTRCNRMLESAATLPRDASRTEVDALRKLGIKILWRRGLARVQIGDDARAALRDLSDAIAMHCRVNASSAVPKALHADFEKVQTRIRGAPALRGIAHSVRTEVYNTTNLHPRPWQSAAGRARWGDLLFFFGGAKHDQPPEPTEWALIVAALAKRKCDEPLTSAEDTALRRMAQRRTENVARSDRFYIFDLKSKRFYTRACEGAPKRVDAAMTCWAPSSGAGGLWSRSESSGFTAAATLIMYGGSDQTGTAESNFSVLLAMELPAREDLLAGGCKLANATWGGTYRWRAVPMAPNSECPPAILSEHAMFLKDNNSDDVPGQEARGHETLPFGGGGATARRAASARAVVASSSKRVDIEVFLHGGETPFHSGPTAGMMIVAQTWRGVIQISSGSEGGGRGRRRGGRRLASVLWTPVVPKRVAKKLGSARFKAYSPVARTNVAHTTVANRFVYVHGGSTSSVTSTDAFELFDMDALTWSPLPCLGDAPKRLQEHTLCAYNHDAHVAAARRRTAEGGDGDNGELVRNAALALAPFEPTHLLLYGGYIPEIGSASGEGGATLTSSDSRDLDVVDGPEKSSICGAPYRRNFFRCDLRTYVWTKLRPTHHKQNRTHRAAQCYGAQRSDGALMVGHGYGLTGRSAAAPTPGGHPEQYSMTPSALWHSYYVTASSCGDDAESSILEHGILVDQFDEADWRATRMDHGAGLAESEGKAAHNEMIRSPWRCDAQFADSIRNFSPFCSGGGSTQQWERLPRTVGPCWTASGDGGAAPPSRSELAARNELMWGGGRFSFAPFDVLKFRQNPGGVSLCNDSFYGELPQRGTQLHASLCALLMPHHPTGKKIPLKMRHSPGEVLSYYVGAGLSNGENSKNISIMTKWLHENKVYKPRAGDYGDRQQERGEGGAALFAHDLQTASSIEEGSVPLVWIIRATAEHSVRSAIIKGPAAEAASVKAMVGRAFSAYANAVAKELARTLPRRAEVDAIVEQRRLDRLVQSTLGGGDDSSHHSDEVVTLLIALDGMTPRVWRRVTVPTKISLHALHDQVLAPTMGWDRAYHAYGFRPRSWRTVATVEGGAIGSPEGTLTDAKPRPAVAGEQARSWIGPAKSVALDIMMAPLFYGGEWAGDSKKVRFVDILQAEKTANPTSTYAADPDLAECGEFSRSDEGGASAASASSLGADADGATPGRWEGVTLDYLYVRCVVCLHASASRATIMTRSPPSPCL